MKKKFISTIGIAGAVLALAIPAQLTYAAQYVGVTVATKGRVSASGKRLKRRSSIYKNYVIRSKANSKGTFKFDDGSVLVLEPNSKVVVNNYKFNGNFKKPRGSINITVAKKSGALWISGALSKTTTLNTSVGLVGLRGTTIQITKAGKMIVVSGQIKVTIPAQGTRPAKTVSLSKGQSLKIVGGKVVTAPATTSEMQKAEAQANSAKAQAAQVATKAETKAAAGEQSSSEKSSQSDTESVTAEAGVDTIISNVISDVTFNTPYYY